MKKIIFGIIALVILSLMALGYSDQIYHSATETQTKVDPKEIIFEHLGDAYG